MMCAQFGHSVQSSLVARLREMLLSWNGEWRGFASKAQTDDDPIVPRIECASETCEPQWRAQIPDTPVSSRSQCGLERKWAFAYAAKSSSSCR